MRRFTTLFLLHVAALLAFFSCASIGSPDGGRYDEEPPEVIGASPADKAVGVNTKRISILFNEYVKLSNASEKVVISPPQLEAANIRADGKRVRVTLYDSLQSNTTYTVDFSDAIEDNNEGNPMGFYTYSFSTGDVIDTMEMAGYVLEAENLEPVKGMLVGLHRVDSTYDDSLFRTKPLIRVSRTNGSGRFSIKGIAPGRYRIFGLNDMDGDYRFSQRAEAIAFDTSVYIPYCRPDLRMDTCWRDSVYYDSIRVVPYTHYFPDDIVLRSFLEEKQDLHLLKTERPEPDWFRLYFTAPVDTLPVIRGLNFDSSCLVAETTEKNDTITYWITDTAFTHRTDSLEMEIRCLDTDSTGILAWKTDTFTLVARKGWSKIWEEKQKQIDDWKKQREKLAKKSKTPLPPEQNPYEQDFMDLKLSPTGTLDPNRNVLLKTNEPIASIDTAHIHLYIERDSNLYREPYLLLPSPYDTKSYTLYAEWKPELKYVVSVDSAALTGIMGHVNRKARTELRVRRLDEYGTMIINLISPDTCMVVQLLNSSDKVVSQQAASANGVAEFYYLKPETYYMRCFADRNGNGKWDTGEYDSLRQPEPVFYFPKPMAVRAGWDMEQAWDVYGIPLTEQKPRNLVKQKADKQKPPSERNKERETEKAKRNSR
ncbi:MAG: Ig-like domain-containing protein [Bacteroidaceae bacterium]|nr:Ig-like domain-containing protein [Bacteroidaceae bacterium]